MNKDNDNVAKEYVFTNFTGRDKFEDNMHWLYPFYHELFPSMDKLITMDTDIVFKVDPVLLFDEFGKFKDSEVLGIANDLYPFYHHFSFSRYLQTSTGLA